LKRTSRAPAANEADEAMSRRHLLTGAVGAAAGAGLAVAGGLLDAAPASADGPDVLLGNGATGTGNNAGLTQTSIIAAPGNHFATLRALNTSTYATGVYGMA